MAFLDEIESGFDLALGFNDLGGTGDFSSEYIVASKRVRDFDISIGLGWGRLGGVEHFSNILTLIDSDRDEIGRGGKRGGGRISLDRFFSGMNTSVFGGIEYFTPIENLSLKVEYDSSDYSRDIGKEIDFRTRIGDIFKQDSRFNYAINYRLFMGDRDKVDFTLGLVRGNTFYANFAVHSNLNYSGIERLIIGGERIRNTNLPGGDYFGNLDENRQRYLTNRTIKEMANIGFVVHEIFYTQDEIAAEISQARFKETEKFIDLASRVLANNSPKNINKITVINIDNGIETFRSSVDREKLIRSVKLGPLSRDLINYNIDTISFSDPITVKNEYLYPNFYWEIKPHLNTTFQHQERFFFWQLEALIQTQYAIKKGLYLNTEIGIDITNNFEDYAYHITDGELYHVRQNRRLYLTEGESGLRRMSLEYLKDLHPNIKARFSVGYLEWMYGGLGGEVIYMPDHKRWGFGIDGYWVKQRDYDQKFSFKDYQTFTGYLSYYQEIPFYNMRMKLSVGKFLAKDIGANIDISRRFKSGARVGAFAALTDCSPECVGEGSFHKGVYFEMPMDLFYSSSETRSKTGYSWSPLTKDAGARLDSGSLYYLMTNATDEVSQLQQKPWSVRKILSGFGMKPKKL